MEQIAEQLRMSVSTVSRALRDVPGIHPQTRSKVRQIAGELGYRTSTRGRRARRTNDRRREVSMVIALRDNHASMNTAQHAMIGATEAADALGLRLTVYHLRREQRDQLRRDRLDADWVEPGETGLGVLTAGRFDAECMRVIASHSPTVSIVHRFPGVPVDVSGFEVDCAFEQMLEALIDRGHRRVAVLRVPVGISWSDDRVAAWHRACDRCGLDHDLSLVFTSRDERCDADQVRSLVDQLRATGATACMAVNDYLGYQLSSAIQQAGLSITVTGFDGQSPPPGLAQITTIRPAIEELGYRAVHQLVQRHRRPEAPPIFDQIAGRLVPGLIQPPYRHE